MGGAVRDMYAGYFGNRYFGAQEQELPLTDWVMKNTRHPKNPSEPFSLVGHEYQRAIINDRSRLKYIRKCSQIGISEVEIREALGLACHHRLNIAYAMPTQSQLRTYVPTRFNPVIAASPELTAELTFSNMALKSFRAGGALYLMHATTSTETFGVALDGVILDEYDRLDPLFIEQYPSRMGHSMHKLETALCTPTVPETGIDYLFLSSDQKFWLTRCHRCNTWQNLGFDNLMFKKPSTHLPDLDLEMTELSGLQSVDLLQNYFDCEPYIGCEKCGQEINRYEFGPDYREWVAKHPNRKASGYDLNRFHVSKYNGAGLPAKPGEQGVGHDAYTILEDFQKLPLSEFRNQVLGQAHASGDGIITEDDVKAALAPPEMNFNSFLNGVSSGGPCFMGIDQKDILHITIFQANRNNIVRMVYAEEKNMVGDGFINTIAHIKLLMKRFRVRFMCVDCMPDRNLPDALVKAFPSRACRVYTNNFKVPFTLPAEPSFLSNIDRTWALDKVASMIKALDNEYQMMFPAGMLLYPKGREILAHFKSMVRSEVSKEGANGMPEEVSYVWKQRGTQANDYFMSIAYAITALCIYVKMHNGLRGLAGSTRCVSVRATGVMSRRAGYALV